MGQRGLWDEVQRIEEIDGMQPSLPRMKELIPWESFRPLLMLILQQLYNLSDEELEYQVND